MEPGLYVVDVEKMYSDSFSINVKLSETTGVYRCLTDKLIEEAKLIAKKYKLSKFIIVFVSLEGMKRVRLYINE
jgi:hypothetical protein